MCDVQRSYASCAESFLLELRSSNPSWPSYPNPLKLRFSRFTTDFDQPQSMQVGEIFLGSVGTLVEEDETISPVKLCFVYLAHLRLALFP